MNIVLDLQPAQTSESGLRGMGRYSLAFARAMAQEADKHDLYIALSQAFPEELERIHADFKEFLPPERFLVWQTPLPVAEVDPRNHWRRQAGELIREQFFRQHRPDVLHVSSLFEGRIDNVVTSVKRFANDLPTSATLYDLIPYLDPERHLHDRDMTLWYMRKIAYLKECDLLFAISEHTRKEAIDALGLDPDRVVNVSADVDQRFGPLELSETDRERVLARHGISRDFLMYTGAMDVHKNINGLIEAYARLPANIRKMHQLVIVCRMQDEYRLRLLRQCRRLALSEDEVVLPGFVSDDDLVALYNMCKLFVFPSFHEGFGLPALEAMRCGAPVIGSDRTSIPEVIGLSAALFDPGSPDNVTAKLYQALSDAQFRVQLREHGRRQAHKFSWRATAKKALEAFEAMHERIHTRNTAWVRAGVKPRLAYISPLPQEGSDVANYSAALLPELASYYQIDLVTDAKEISDPMLAANFAHRSLAQFENDAQHYDRILYHFWDSARHNDMLSLLERFPGTVILHDFFLGSALRDLQDTEESRVFFQVLYRSHGYSALRQQYENRQSAQRQYPCNLDVLRYAQGVIVRSPAVRALSVKWYGQDFDAFAMRVVSPECSPSLSARSYAEAIEKFAYDHPIMLQSRLAKDIAEERAPVSATQHDLLNTAFAISENAGRVGQRQILIDISTLVQIDSRSGIQRVVRSLLDEFLAHAPSGYRVEPVYRAPIGYRYARQFTLKFLNIDMRMDDLPVEVDKGDIFLGLDLDAEINVKISSWLRRHGRRGMRIYYVMYDLLPALHPEWFPTELNEVVNRWLKNIVEYADGLACISGSVARELQAWLKANPPKRYNPLNIGYFHLGADIESSRPNSGMSEEDAHALQSISERESLLMVGTVEPRKGHTQVLSALEHLWEKGSDLHLVIVGKPGWLVRPLIKRLRHHPELRKRLFWLEQVSDEALLKLYESASALLMASEGEGYGLPLIEAAQHELPIIARDLAVFREVAGEHACYFSGESPQALADRLEEWLVLYRHGNHPCSLNIHRLTWRESAVQLQRLFTQNDWFSVWEPNSHRQDHGDLQGIEASVTSTS